MRAELIVRRRAVSTIYEKFLEVDRAWNVAAAKSNTWFPEPNGPHHRAMGNPGSQMRQLYEQRERAISQLEVAILKLNVAKARLAKKQRAGVRVVAILPAPSP